MTRIHGERRSPWSISLVVPILWASGCDQTVQPSGERRREEAEIVAAHGAERTRDFEIRVPSAVSVPLGGLAEIDVTLQGEDQFEKLDLTVDVSSEPGLVAVPGTIPRYMTLGTIRVGARAPLALGATVALRVTARSRSGAIVRTAASTATVVDRTGSLDPSFGGTGTFVASGTKYTRDGFSDIQVEPDGSVLATGVHSTMAGTLLRAVHVGADGRGDPAFAPSDVAWSGGGGAVIIRLPDHSKHGTGLAIRRQSTGRIILAGVDRRRSDRIVLAGILPNGVLDSTFGESGLRRLAPDGGDAAALALAVAPDDALVVGGYRGRRPLIARLTPDGAPDPTFGDGGYAVLPFDDAASEVRSVTLAPDGKIVVGGSVRRGDSRFVAVWRFLENGGRDEHFGTDWTTPGLAMLPVSGEESPMGGLTLLPDGRIVVAVNTDTGWPVDERAKPYLLRLSED